MFDEYCSSIKELNSFEKEDILVSKFKLYSKDNIEIYYAPHNETVNELARVFIVGITPGWTQTSIAYKTANDGLKKGFSDEVIKKNCKKESRFAGSMRNNLIEMLNLIELNEKLGITSCSELFECYDNLLHTTSLIPYPVFINNKNYTGSNPKILDNMELFGYVKKYFYEEIKKLPNVLIIPLGKAVEEVLEFMISENLLRREQCLFGFPHPSGANGHRRKQFENNKESLINIIDNYFN